MNNIKRGFSLVELLISLIVISCITAAFTPIITKKFSSGVFGGGGTDDLTTDCSDKFGDYCTLCTSSGCIDCGISCPQGQYQDTKSCTCKDCKETYGEDCEKCTEKKCLTCPDGEYLDSDENCKSCSDKFTNCATCTESECTSCADGYVLTNPTSNTPCSSFSCSSPDYIQIGNLCITKKNMGDGNSLIIPSGVNVVSTGTRCNSSASNFCCWQGQTALQKLCDNSNGSNYDGCTRTMCDGWAADYICKNFSAGGKTWRLASIDEMSNWDNNSIGKDINGLQLCDIHAGYLSAYCGGSFDCIGNSDGFCNVSRVWSNLISNESNTYCYMLRDGTWEKETCPNGRPSSTRCVTEMSQSCADKISKGCLICDGNTCLKCASGYALKNGKCEIDCASKFGSSCTSCTTSKCTACASGYHISSASSNPACVQDFTCSGSDFMQIGSLCVTRRNMGDSTALKISSGVNVVNTGATCSSSASNLCCWKGNTSGTDCDNNGGAYSGCYRTVCDWYAADYICKNFTAGGRTWRLPIPSEMSNWGSNSIGLGVNGLQLCDWISGDSSAYCDGSRSCPRSYNGSCLPYIVWSGTVSGSTGAYGYNLSGGSWTQRNNHRTYAFSVRCVTEL